MIKNYFLNYSETLSNDFVLSEGGKKLELMASDIHDWKITFVETGLQSNIGQRLKAVERVVGDEPEFLANYSDGLSNLSLPDHLEHFRSHDAVASFVSVKPNLSYHLVSSERRTRDGHRGHPPDAHPHQRRILRASSARSSTTSATARSWSSSRSSAWLAQRQLAAYEYDGFWMSMDTFKDRQQLEEIYARGNAPWEVWNEGRPAASGARAAVYA